VGRDRKNAYSSLNPGSISVFATAAMRKFLENIFKKAAFDPDGHIRFGFVYEARVVFKRNFLICQRSFF
jgi:hypothetical protein